MDIPNLEYIGMLGMGAFVGGVLNYGLPHIKDGDNFRNIIAIILGSAFSGVTFVFLQLLLIKSGPNHDAVFMYPLGLLLALLWAQIPVTFEKYIKSDQILLRVIGIIHFTVLSTFTIYIGWKLFFT